MGLMGLLFKLSLECFDVFAWPFLALGYPLRASIQAIETDSKLDTQKLITYWVCFSFMLLFEHAFVKLLEWLPYWPYMKLLIIGCLVIRHFNGSFYVYKHIVRPCLSLNPHIILNWLINLKEFLNLDNLLNEVKREAKETGSDTSENLVAFGSLPAFKLKLEDTKVEKKDDNLVATMEKKEVTSTKQIGQIKPDLGLLGNRTCASMEIKEMTDAIIAGSDFNILPSKKIEEWPCGLCQITTTSKTDLISHYEGKLHKDACEKLKLTSKNRNPPSVGTDAILENREMDSAVIADRDFADKQHSTSTQKLWICGVCHETSTSEPDFHLHRQGKQHANACEKLNLENQTSNAEIPASVETSVALDSKEMGTATLVGKDIPDKQHLKSVQKMSICSVCQETAANMTDFISHLQGKRHVEACGKLKVKQQAMKLSNVSLSPAATCAPPDSGCNLPDNPQSASTQSPWTCALCEVTATRKLDLVSHFQGRRHEHALNKLKFKIDQSRSNIFPAKKLETSAPLENQEMAVSKLPEVHSKNIQKPWTCGICGVTVTCEATLLSHLQGRKHVNACEKLLKETIETSKRAVSPAPVEKASTSCEEEEEKYAAGNVSSPVGQKRWRAKKEGKQENMEIKVVEVRNSLWWCNLCNISCNSEGNMDSHLNGSQHLARTKLEAVGRPELFHFT